MPENYEEFGREEVPIEEHSFDELAKGVADDTLPRGKALKSVFAAIVGGFLGVFALPPREAEARLPNTLWAVVNADGTLARSKGGFYVAEKLDTGFYAINNSKRNLNLCALSATIDSDTSSPFTPGGTGQIAVSSSGVTALVNTAKSDGSAADKKFHLIAEC
jgi:hypothetical protein